MSKPEAFCKRCNKVQPYHLSMVVLYGVKMMPDRICDGCDYAIQGG